MATADRITKLDDDLTVSAIGFGAGALTSVYGDVDDAEAAPRALRPLLRVAGIGPEPDSAKDAWDRIQLFFATHLN